MEEKEIMLFFLLRRPVLEIVAGIILVDLALAAASEAGRVLINVPKGKRIRFGFYREDEEKKG